MSAMAIEAGWIAKGGWSEMQRELVGVGLCMPACHSTKPRRAMPRQGSFRFCNKLFHHSTFTWTALGAALSFFGRRSLSTPSLNSAVTLAASVPSGIVKLRLKLP